MYFLAVNYHYIDKEDKYPHSGIYPLSSEKLKQQLKELGRYFTFVSQEEIVAAIIQDRPLPQMSCLVTFDDGLRCQYENALGILDALRIPAMFFVNTLPYAEQKACLVHKIHYLRANVRPEKFIAEIIKQYAKETGKDIDVLQEFDGASALRQYRYDNETEARLKFLLNNFMDYALAQRIVGSIFVELVQDERDFCRELYLTDSMLIDLSKRGYLGIHSHGHLPLKKLSQEALLADLRKCILALEDIVQRKSFIKGFSYPYGSPETVSQELSRWVADSGLGIIFGFTMERAFNRSMREPLLFARADTNDVLRGRFPGFFFNAEGKLEVVNGKFSQRREFYFDEEEKLINELV